MNCVKRTGLYLFCLGITVVTAPGAVFSKENKENGSGSTNSPSINAANNHAMKVAPVSEFGWEKQRLLSWNDFKGPVKATSEESAAATHCGIGFKTCRREDGKQGIVVYNTFYVNKSWVRPDAKIAEILFHEQGHFDLCEIYTRKLRVAMSTVDLTAPNLKQVLEQVYFDVKEQYENRQFAYETETTHGTNFAHQRRWHDIMSNELRQSETNDNSYAAN